MKLRFTDAPGPTSGGTGEPFRSLEKLLSERFTFPIRAALSNPEEPPIASLDIGHHPGAHHKLNAIRAAAMIFVMLIVVSCSGRDAAPAPISMFDGSTRQLSDFGTEILVLNFWASWCAPCVEEMPVLERFWQEHKESVTLIGVGVSTPKLAVSGFLHRVGVKYPIATYEDGALTRKYSVSLLPTPVVVNSDGDELVNHSGVITKEQLEQAVQKIAGEGPG
jgi:thiol-disulfide isomerase/thioredoxin